MGADAAIATVGLGFTTTLATAEPVQPAEVPVTVYCVPEAGETTTSGPLSVPGVQS